MKQTFTAAVALLLGIASLTANDKAPRGYEPIAELEVARSEAKGKSSSSLSSRA